jgi:hypothetical protein
MNSKKNCFKKYLKKGGMKSKYSTRRKSYSSPLSDKESTSSTTRNKNTNMEAMHKYNMKRNKEYKKEYEDYINFRNYFINAPIEEIDYAFVHTFDKKEADKIIKKKREADFDKQHIDPKVLYFYYKGPIKEYNY